MRRFEVWLDKNVPGIAPSLCEIELSDLASEIEIERACNEALDYLIENELDTGWREVTEEEPSRVKRKAVRRT
ncbi:MAG TPA: hypothetical protein VIJ33_10770 [Solirubrobacteraceae bacterium]